MKRIEASSGRRNQCASVRNDLGHANTSRAIAQVVRTADAMTLTGNEWPHRHPHYDANRSQRAGRSGHLRDAGIEPVRSGMHLTAYDMLRSGKVLHFNESSLRQLRKWPGHFGNPPRYPFTIGMNTMCQSAAWLPHRGISANKEIAAQGARYSQGTFVLNGFGEYLGILTLNGRNSNDRQPASLLLGGPNLRVRAGRRR